MCGIAGFYSAANFSADDAKREVIKMGMSLRHRGPDDSGEWIDGDAGIALAHRRLSVLDLSAAGHQPMVSDSGRYVIIFNGEIYNHKDLRNLLEGSIWRSTTDTETLLHLIDRFGLRTTLQKVTGMFALALWDRQERELILTRDRMGEKPLYYGWQGKNFLFASELKALKEHPEFIGDIDTDAFSLYMGNGYVPTPLSIYKGIFKLQPGTLITINERTEIGTIDKIEKYWSLEEIASASFEEPFCGSEEEAVVALEKVLSGAIQKQMIADVPLGAFLSGGIDSSTVVALMQKQSSRPIKTFTIGFGEHEYNEAKHAKEVAKHVGTDHTELYITPREAMDVIPSLPSLYDEPFGDASAIPTYLVSKLARGHVTVSLSGDGGDELFGGYLRYFQYPAMWAKLSQLPTTIWKGVSIFSKSAPLSLLNSFGNRLIALRGRVSSIPAGLRLKQLATAMSAGNELDFVQAMRTADVDFFMKEPSVNKPPHRPTILPMNSASLSEKMMLNDALNYLPDDILAKVDRAAMAVSLETRVPLLDHQVVEFAARVPFHLKYRNGEGKWLLRQLLYRHVPQSLVERPKMGFGVPTDTWIRHGQGKEWADSLLNKSRITQEGFFDSATIHRRWREHCSGRYNWQGPFWRILMFQQWLDQQNT
jgi:asparagine synthase (glutamine-hydrolysing)